MTVTEFLPHYSVEICAPKHGSGYRIGGPLVLTAGHLFTELGTCQVRSKGLGDSKKGAFDQVEATVVWIASGVDVALVELPDAIEPCDPVQFGLLPDSMYGESIDFQFYGYPKWGATKTRGNRSGSGGRHVKGEIRLADTSFEDLVVLRSENASDNTSDGSSTWVGASGAAIVCAGYVVAVQSQHQNPKMFTALEAAPLSKVYQCPVWCDLLEKHGISPTPEQIKLPQSKVKRSPIVESRNSPLNISEITNYIDLLNWIEEKTRFFSIGIRSLTPSQDKDLKRVIKIIIENSLETEVAEMKVLELVVHYISHCLKKTPSSVFNLMPKTQYINEIKKYHHNGTIIRSGNSSLSSLVEKSERVFGKPEIANLVKKMEKVNEL